MRAVDIVAFIGLGILAVIDVKKKKIPVWSVGIFSVVLLTIRLSEGIVWTDFIGGLVLGMVMLILAITSKQKIGIGDALVLCALGIGYKLEDMIGILGISFLLTAIWAMGLLIMKKASKKTELPFLPYLLAGHLFVIWIR